MEGQELKEFVARGSVHEIRVMCLSGRGRMARVEKIVDTSHGGVGVEGVVSRGGGGRVAEVTHTVAVAPGKVGEVGWEGFPLREFLFKHLGSVLAHCFGGCRDMSRGSTLLAGRV